MTASANCFDWRVPPATLLLGLIYGQWVMLLLYDKSQATEMSAEHALDV